MRRSALGRRREIRLNGRVITPSVVPIDRLIDSRTSVLGDSESKAIRRAADRGDYERLVRGIYREAVPPIEKIEWAQRPAEAKRRYLEQAAAVALTRRSQVVFSHRTALAILGLPLLGPWPDEIDILEPLDSSRRTENGVRVHRLTFEAEDLVPWGEFFVTSPERTLADVARDLPPIISVPALDAGLVELSRDGIREQLERNDRMRGTARALKHLEFADPRSGSPGESGSRVIMAMLGTPKPELQVVHASTVPGMRRFKTDFEWPGLKKIGEFDGRFKYLESEELSGKAANVVVYEEKLREDSLRGEGNTVGRWAMIAVRKPPLLRDELGRIGVPMTRGNRYIRPLW